MSIEATAPPIKGIAHSARRRNPAWRKAFPYLLVAPAVMYLLSITLWPGIYALYRSFLGGPNRFKPEWIGTANYQELFSNNAFWAAIWNTLFLGSITLAIEFVIAMVLAALVYRSSWARSWRILFMLPMLFMPSAVSYMWKLLFNDGRVIADLINRAGFDVGNIDWMSSVFNARFVLVVTDVWQWTPFLFIIFVAGLQGQDKEIEEAARLDGASWSAIFFNISLPLMRPVIAIALVLRGIDLLNNMAAVNIITQGTPGGATETLSYYIYRTSFRSFEHGVGSAASVVVLIATIILAQSLVRRFFRSGTEA
jgi:multiple sugar transport system permease protein